MISIFKVFKFTGIGIFPLLLQSLLAVFLPAFQSALIAFLLGLGISVYAIVKPQLRVFLLNLFPCLSILLIYMIAVSSRSSFQPFMRASIILLVLLIFHAGLILIFRKIGVRLYHLYRGKVQEIYNPLDDYFTLANLVFIAFSIYLVVSVAYGVITETYYGIANIYLEPKNLFFFFIALYIYFFIRAIFIANDFKEETWLPIVDTVGNVQGRIALSTLKDVRSKLMVPVIRIFYLYKGLFYLSPYYLADSFGKNKMDFPVNEFLRFGETLDECVQRQICQFTYEHPSPEFRLKHKYKPRKVKNVHYLVFLYTAEVENEIFFKDPYFKGGKLWTKKQILENLNTGYFSSQLEADFSFMFLAPDLN